MVTAHIRPLCSKDCSKLLSGCLERLIIYLFLIQPGSSVCLCVKAVVNFFNGIDFTVSHDFSSDLNVNSYRLFSKGYQILHILKNLLLSILLIFIFVCC